MMKIEMGIGWLPDETCPPGHIRSAHPGEYATEILRLRAILEDAALYVAVCPVPSGLAEPSRTEMLERRAKITTAASEAYRKKPIPATA